MPTVNQVSLVFALFHGNRPHLCASRWLEPVWLPLLVHSLIAHQARGEVEGLIHLPSSTCSTWIMVYSSLALRLISSAHAAFSALPLSHVICLPLPSLHCYTSLPFFKRPLTLATLATQPPSLLLILAFGFLWFGHLRTCENQAGSIILYTHTNAHFSTQTNWQYLKLLRDAIKMKTWEKFPYFPLFFILIASLKLKHLVYKSHHP